MKVITELVREGLLIQSRGPITLYNFTTADYTQLSLLLVFKICKLKLVEGGPFPRYCRVGAVPGPSRGWHAVLIQAVGVGNVSYWVVGMLWVVPANTWSGPMWATWLKDIGAEISRDLRSGLETQTLSVTHGHIVRSRCIQSLTLHSVKYMYQSQRGLQMGHNAAYRDIT